MFVSYSFASFYARIIFKYSEIMFTLIQTEPGFGTNVDYRDDLLEKVYWIHNRLNNEGSTERRKT